MQQEGNCDERKETKMVQYYGRLWRTDFSGSYCGTDQYYKPEFRTSGNFLSLLRQSSINGFIAFGMTFVILTGAIDLSVGSVLALSTALCAGMITSGVPAGVAMLASLLIGALLGLISGVLVTRGRLQPFIATLITMTAYRGLTMIYTNGKPISRLGESMLLKSIGKGDVFGIPVPVILLILMFAFFWFLLTKTTFGRHIYATGSNWKAAELAGVNIRKTKIIAYVISGVMAALSGLILLSRLNSAQLPWVPVMNWMPLLLPLSAEPV